jgi:hypothetical protein
MTTFIKKEINISNDMNTHIAPDNLLSGELSEFIAQLSAEEERERSPAPKVHETLNPQGPGFHRVPYSGVTLDKVGIVFPDGKKVDVPGKFDAVTGDLHVSMSHPEFSEVIEHIGTERPMPKNDSTEQLNFPKKVQTDMLPPVPSKGVPVADKQDYYQNEKGGDQYMYTQVKDAKVIANPSPTARSDSPYEDGDKPTEPNEMKLAEKKEVTMADEKKEVGVPKADEIKPTNIPAGDSKYTEKGPGIVDGKSTFLESVNKMEEKKEIGVPEKVEAVIPTKVGSKELDPAGDRFAHLEAEIEMLKSKLPKPEDLPKPRISSGEIISPPVEKEKLPDMKGLEHAIDEKFVKHMKDQEGITRI